MLKQGPKFGLASTPMMNMFAPNLPWRKSSIITLPLFTPTPSENRPRHRGKMNSTLVLLIGHSGFCIVKYCSSRQVYRSPQPGVMGDHTQAIITVCALTIIVGKCAHANVATIDEPPAGNTGLET